MIGIKENGVWYEDLEKEGPNLKTLKKIYILIRGSYTDSYRKNPQPLDIVGDYDLVSKQFGLLAFPYDDSIRIFLKRKGIIK